MDVGQHVAAVEGRVVVVARAVVEGHGLGPGRHAVGAVHVAHQRHELQGRDRVVVVEGLQGGLDVGGVVAHHVHVDDLHVVALPLAPGLQIGHAAGDLGVAVADHGPGAVGALGAGLVRVREAGDVRAQPGVQRRGQGAGLGDAAADRQLDLHDAGGLGRAGRRVVVERADRHRHHGAAGQDGGLAHAQQGGGGLVDDVVGRRVHHEVGGVAGLHGEETEGREGNRLGPYNPTRHAGVTRHRHQPRGDRQAGGAVRAVDGAAVDGQGAPGLVVDPDLVHPEGVQGELEPDGAGVAREHTPAGRGIARLRLQGLQFRRGGRQAGRRHQREDHEGETSEGSGPQGAHPEPPYAKNRREPAGGMG